MFSKSFLSIDVNEMGRLLFMSVRFFLLLSRGSIVAFYHKEGKSPRFQTILKICVIVLWKIQVVPIYRYFGKKKQMSKFLSLDTDRNSDVNIVAISRAWMMIFVLFKMMVTSERFRLNANNNIVSSH